mmetsp:Transcript_21500/g.61440  ORF Transcript_21500/g.61440 Transcript_21500/m.61440 type:complete len:96 (+) Transcript_21500:152-439(+)
MDSIAIGPFVVMLGIIFACSVAAVTLWARTGMSRLPKEASMVNRDVESSGPTLVKEVSDLRPLPSVESEAPLKVNPSKKPVLQATTSKPRRWPFH